MIVQDLSKARILIVDDDPLPGLALQRMLESEGYKNIETIQDSRLVQDKYRENFHDIILLDLSMPHMDGYQVINKLKGEFEDTMPPVLILTGRIEQEFRQQALDIGAIDYVTKPFDFDELRSRVRNLLQVQLANKFMRNQNEILEQKVQKRTEEILHTRLQLIQRLGRAAEYRDNETGLHIIRMSKIAMLLGKASGMDDRECDLLLNASPMHDVGKIGIPDRILLKPGKLDADEWEIMKTHTHIGADILSGDNSDLLMMAHDIALTHHEKWDGSGYPYGLKGEDIPFVGRICALADVFDALMSDRPYKHGWSIDQAIDLIINKERNKHFDPTLVDHFQQLLPEIINIQKKYSEPEPANEVMMSNLGV